MANDQVRVLFVCLGNVCRSPLAQGVFRQLVARAGLAERFAIDSAATGDHRVGQSPDRKTMEAARRHGIELTSTGRQITTAELASADYILVMDSENLRVVTELTRNEVTHADIRLLREFDKEAIDDQDVPDPTDDGPHDLEEVHAILERSCRALLDHIRVQHGL